jgi:hypothetical protein
MDHLNEKDIEQRILLEFFDDNNNNVYDSEDDDDDDDQTKDPADDQEFDKELTRDSEQGTATVLEVDEPDSFADEEPEGSDSGIEGGDASDIEIKSLESLPIISQVRRRFSSYLNYLV